MIYDLEQIKRRCDKEKGKLFTIPKDCFGKRSKGYPIYKPTTYLRKWDFRDEPDEVLAKYDLEPIRYIYCGSHTRRTQKDRDYLLYRDIVKRKKASKEIREFFVNYVNYYVNEKKENVIEVVKRFFKAKEMIFLNKKNKNVAERHINDRYLVEQAQGKKIKVLSTGPKDTTLVLDKATNRLKERDTFIGEYKSSINEMITSYVLEYIKNNKDVAEVYQLMDYYLEKVDFIERGVKNE